jgi:serine/threonine protein kinase
MASVYEIWNKELEVFRAVKLMHPNCSNEALQRFQTEIKITAKMNHPNIVQIHGVGTWNNLPYIEMEKVEGITLEALISSRGALPVNVCIAIGILVARALHYAHNHKYMLYNKEYEGVIHRDLKPGNVMVSVHEHLKLMDFGIARPADASFHTVDGSVVGTLQYLSPEQLEGRHLDIRTDIYSFGACLYEAACGNYAFPESNIQRLIADKSKNRYRPLSDYSEKFPDGFIRIVHQCMNHERKMRPESAHQLCEGLGNLLSKNSADSPEEIIRRFMSEHASEKVEITPVRKVSLHAGVAAALLLIAAIIGAVVVSMKSTNDDTVNTSEAVENRSVTRVANAPVVPESVTIKNQLPKMDTAHNTGVIKPTPSIHKTVSVSSGATKTIPILEQLYSKHNTHDRLQIMKDELVSGNASLALTVYNSMTQSEARSLEALVLRTRALKKTDKKLLTSFLSELNVQEGEIFLEKAWIKYTAGEISEAEVLLNKAFGAPRALISYESLVKEVFYLNALCATKQFDSNPNDKTWKAALEAWYNIKKEMRAQPEHSYVIAAEKEIVRIGTKFRSSSAR